MITPRTISGIRRFHTSITRQNLSDIRSVDVNKLKEKYEIKRYDDLKKQNEEHKKELAAITAKVIGLKDLLKENERVLSRIVANNNKGYISKLKTTGKQPFPPVNSF